MAPNDCETLIARGQNARRENQPLQAKEHFSTALHLARAAGDQMLSARALTGMAQIERDLHSQGAALVLYLEAAQSYRSLNAPVHLAHAVRHMGDILRKEERFQEARPHYEEALLIYRNSPETPSLDLANALRGFAPLEEASGNAERARALWKEAGALYASVNVWAGVEESQVRIAHLE